MIREISFRGKWLDNQKKWIYGYLVVDWKGVTHIIEIDGLGPESTACTDCGSNTLISFEVNPETIGQYIGRTNKDGTRIFEGDILRVYQGRIIGEVIFDIRGCYFGVKVSGVETWGFSNNFLEVKDIEIIGNIHDNPELLT